MSSERASTTRQRLAGKICCICGRLLSPPTQPGERRCEACLPRPHRVYMFFFVRGKSRNISGSEWVLNFLEPDLKTPIGPIRSYPDETTVRHLAKRGQSLLTEDARMDFERELTHGRGSVWLQLTDDQYRRLGRR